MAETVERVAKEFKVGETVLGNCHINPRYLENSKMKVSKIGRKNVSVIHEAYPGETFPVDPNWIEHCS